MTTYTIALARTPLAAHLAAHEVTRALEAMGRLKGDSRVVYEGELAVVREGDGARWTAQEWTAEKEGG